jgi:hypothetical protein
MTEKMNDEMMNRNRKMINKNVNRNRNDGIEMERNKWGGGKGN